MISDDLILKWTKSSDYSRSVRLDKDAIAFRDSFVRKFPVEKIETLTFKDFLAAKDGYGNPNSFCKQIYKDSQILCSRGELNINMFGIYYADGTRLALRPRSVYEKQFGDDYDSAFKYIKREVYDFLVMAAKGNIQGIIRSKMHSGFKYKLLSIYNMDRFIPVCTADRCQEYVDALDLGCNPNDEIIKKMVAIENWKNSNPLVSSWDNYMLMRFCCWLADDELKISGRKGKKDIERNPIVPKNHASSPTQPSTGRIITVGSFGKWQIVGQSTIALDIPFEDTDSETFEISKEVFDYFIEDVSLKECELNLSYGEIDSYGIVLNDNHSGGILSIDDSLVQEIEAFSQLHQTGVAVYFERKEKRRYKLKFLPGAERAIEAISRNDVEESELEEERINWEMNEDSFSKISSVDYVPVPEERPKEIGEQFGSSRKPYPRDPMKKAQALARAQYRCELDRTHPSFISKTTGKFYMETHHLIPVEYWESFNKNLDVLANIICLCSNCHNEIHYGIDAEKLIRSLYEDRKEELSQAQIGISEKLLLDMYTGAFVKGEKIEE